MADQTARPFKPGDRVRWKAGRATGTIRSIDDDLAEVYIANTIQHIFTSQLEHIPEDPRDDLLQGQIGRAEPYGLRLQALYLKHAYRFDPCAGLSNARVEPALHQVYVANRVVSKNPRPRMILADEVGLGKTIEAGLVIKELRARGLIERVLVITPASLTIQWQQELRSKFNETFEFIDGAGVKFLSRDGSNPWSKRDNVICSLEFARSEKNTKSITEADWDIVVFDEAHRLRRRKIGNRTQYTRAYQLADKLKDHFGLLLLTATPMQLDPFELYSLIELVEPGLYSYDEYESRSEEIPKLNKLMKRLLTWEQLTHEKQNETSNQLPDLDLETLDGRSQAELQLLRSHPLADVLIRNRKTEVGGFTKRRARIYMVDQTEEEANLYADITDYIVRGYNRASQEKKQAIGFVMVTYQKLLASSSYALYEGFKRRIARLEAGIEELADKNNRSNMDKVLDSEQTREMAREDENPRDMLEKYYWGSEFNTLEIDITNEEINELKAIVERLENIRDSKALELLRALQSIPSDHKVLIFTQYIDTQEFLRQTLETNGYDVVIFNGGMRLENKEMAVQAFRTKSQILITTEAGGEGRNFQFSSTMFNYDLPWNPMKIEQRIGRLDRIGQTLDVHIYNIACRGTIEERILDVLDKRIGLFEQSVGSLEPILGELEKTIETLVLTRNNDEFQNYLKNMEDRIFDARLTEQTWKNFVMDRASFRRDIASKIVNDTRLATPADLKLHIKRAINFLGGWLDEHNGGWQIIQLPDKLIRILKVKKKTYEGNFDPKDALKNEHLPFFAFGHSLIDAVVDMQTQAQPPVWTGSRMIEGIPTGVYLEVFYEMVTQGDPPVGRIIRHLVRNDGNLEERTVTSMPEIGREADMAETPPWLPHTIEISRRAAKVRFRSFYKEARHRHDQWKQSELNREARIFQYKRDKLIEAIELEKFRIIIFEEGTEEQKRVVPARRGILRGLQERKEELESYYEATQQEIHNKPFSPSMKVLAAGLVQGR